MTGKVINKQVSYSVASLAVRTTVKLRKCLGVLKDGAYCNEEFESLDASNRLCSECKKTAGIIARSGFSNNRRLLKPIGMR